MPYTPRALNVFRSAWMPAPPPESDPAMVSARGTSVRTKMVPSSGFERSFRAVGVHSCESALRDLTDVCERDTEAFVELAAGGIDRGGIDGRDELVVFTARERELERIGLHDLGEFGQPLRDRHGRELHSRAHGALGAETREIEQQAVAEVHQGRRPGPHVGRGTDEAARRE